MLKHKSQSINFFCTKTLQRLVSLAPSSSSKKNLFPEINHIMSYNRLIYDTCAYKKELDQSTGPLSYTLNPMKYENCNKCRMELGLVGGPAVSQIAGNLVDLENDLRGQTRPASNCPNKHYQPSCKDKIGDACQPSAIKLQDTPCAPGRSIDTRLKHLRPCQMIRYKPVPLPPPMNIDSCGKPTTVTCSQPVGCSSGPTPFSK